MMDVENGCPKLKVKHESAKGESPLKKWDICAHHAGLLYMHF